MFPGDFICYCLQSMAPGHSNRTYIGMTNNMRRRLAEHNGKRKGGARYTHSHRPWRVVFVVGGFPNRSEALRFEWAMKKRRHHSKGGGLKGRFRTLAKLFNKERVTKHAMPWKRLSKVRVICRFSQRRFKTLAKPPKLKGKAAAKFMAKALARAQFSFKFPSK